MLENEKKRNRKIFVEEAIGTRKYFSYRADLLLNKVILCVVVYAVIYTVTDGFLISLLLSLQVLLIFTLINKLNLERKEKEGRAALLTKIKKEYFLEKLGEMDISKFEGLAVSFFLKKGYVNIKKSGKYTYSMVKDKENFYIKIFKLYGEIEIEKIDIRSFISLMAKDKIKKGFLITVNEISEEAKTLMDKIQKDFQLTIVSSEDLFEMAEENNYLPGDEFFIKKIKDEKIRPDRKNMKNIRYNIVSNKKIVIYIFSAALFYILSFLMPYNNLTIYISYYFVVLTFITAVYIIFVRLAGSKTPQ